MLNCQIFTCDTCDTCDTCNQEWMASSKNTTYWWWSLCWFHTQHL